MKTKLFSTGLLLFTLCLIRQAIAQSTSPTPAGPQSQSAPSGFPIVSSCGGVDPGAVHQVVSYSDSAPDCGVPTVTVATLTNPFPGNSLVIITFSVDDDILINGAVYQSAGADFTFSDIGDDPCPTANGRHSDSYCSIVGPGEEITLGVRNNFRGSISLNADVYFNPPGTSTDTALQVDPNKTKDDDAHTKRVPCPMAQYSFHLMLASLHIEDTPVSYTPPRGPAIDFRVAYNQREANQPANFDYSNFGPKWTFNWLSYVTDNPADPSTDASVYVRGGGTEVYSGFNSDIQSYAPDPQSQAVLVRVDNGLHYEKRFPDGSKEVFGLSDGMPSYPRRVFLTSVVDPSGNAVTLGYDSGFRLRAITDPTDQATTLDYEDSNDSLKITKVTDPFGRFAKFDYNEGELSKITDPVQIESSFHYQDGTDFIDSMTTPYGTTTFAQFDNGNFQRSIQATDPLGGKELVVYGSVVNGIAPTDSTAPSGVTNSGLNLQTTLFWDKKAMADAPRDPQSAQLTRWLTSTDGTTVSGIKHSEKRALENRVWYTYDGQPDGNTVGTSAQPNRTARILDGGDEQDWHYSYNQLGNITQKVDPVGRVTSYEYDDNNIDLLHVYQNADQIAGYTYNSAHEPIIATGADGQTTHYFYRPDGHGQIQSVTNARGDTTTYGYGENGNPADYLTSVTSPMVNGATAITTFDYHLSSGGFAPANRPHSVTNLPDNYTVATDYDNIDRPTTITYPGGTTDQFQYSQHFGQSDPDETILDLTASKDRDGRWTTRHYDANRHLVSMTDPLGQTTTYNWCACGALTSITDPNGNFTTFHRDLQSRVDFKIFGNSTRIFGPTSISYEYDATGRLFYITNAGNDQQTYYTYLVDDNVGEIDYFSDPSEEAFAPTPSVTFTYDPRYNRVTSMTDGIGTTNYSYYPAGSLGGGKPYQTSGPLPNSTITFNYDALGRVVGQDVNGTGSTVSYDALGRVTGTANVLGAFTRSYDSATTRLLAMNYPNGQLGSYSYFDNANDRRLQSLQNIAGTSVNLSRFDYTYDPEGQIQTWNKTLSSTETDLSFVYDDAKRLVSVGLGRNYTYDSAGNRLSDSFHASHNHHGGDSFTANVLNQLDTITRDPGVGPLPPPMSLTYDASGNMLYDGITQTFEWDAANRVAAINYLDTGGRTEFAYDGLGRRVKITEYNGLTAATIQPGGGDYETFTSAPFAVSSGNYTLIFQGLNPNGDNSMMLVDAVQLNEGLVPNGSFENPPLNDGDYEYGGGGDTIWTYQGDTGIAANGSYPVASNPSAPDGSQVGFVQDIGVLSQSFAIPAGTYTLSFAAAQSVAVNETSQSVRVFLRGQAPVAVRTFVWCGNTICEERDATGATTTKRFFAEGEQRVGGADAGNYYYSRDHLGSIREVTDVSGNLVAQMDYDAWGKESVVTGNMNFDFGFTGHFFHQPSGMNLSMNRAYHPTLARWISRDPLPNAEMNQGPNLYSYVNNDPINATDPLGLCPGDWLDLLNQFMFGAEEGAYATLDSALLFWHPFSDRYNANDPGIWFSQDVGGPALQFLVTAGLGEAISGLRGGEAAFSTYEDITEGNSVFNRVTNVTQSEFESNLLESGYTSSVSRDGAVTVFQKDGVKYVVRGFSDSGGPTADFYATGKSILLKIRLGGP